MGEERSARVSIAFSIVVLALAAGLPAPASAGSGSAGIAVSARVRPYARIELASPPDDLTLTAADVERGHVDVRAGGRWVVKTNATNYDLEIEVVDPDGGILAVEVRGLGPARTFSPPVGRVPRSRGASIRDVLEPSWRIHLTADARPGKVPWPIRLRAVP